jgi:hypothetical protein
MSYFWQEGYPLTVITDENGLPLRLSWDWYQGSHEIYLIGDSWSIDDEWWIEPKKRTYYKVTTESGQALIIFLDGVTNEWFIQWVYD